MGKISLVSLGCPKNLVDSENLLKKLKDVGFSYTPAHEEADILMINTCGFIESAKKESVDEILRLCGIREKGPRKKLIVFGCLAQRYGEELKKEIPEIDVLWGVGEDEKIVEYCMQSASFDKKIAAKKKQAEKIALPVLSAAHSYAYLKIAEGCDRACSYCVIPGIRGKFRSRRPDEVLKEAEGLLSTGAKELIVIAQDITAYGKDMKGYDLNRLIRELASIKGDFWIRLLYLYPTAITSDLLNTMGSEEKVCKYIDMPLQHSEQKILKLMGRGGSRGYFEKLIRRIRDMLPGVNIRTTLIVGFPCETKTDFTAMADFVSRMKFERLGAFTYSREEGTPAFKMRQQVSSRTKQLRYDKIMKIQSAISLEKNLQLVGRTFRALVDEIDGSIAVARIYSQAPEIDGVVLLHDADVVQGAFVNVKITDAYDYDLKGTVMK